MLLLVGLICFYTGKNSPRLPSIHFNNDQSEKQIRLCRRTGFGYPCLFNDIRFGFRDGGDGGVDSMSRTDDAWSLLAISEAIFVPTSKDRTRKGRQSFICTLRPPNFSSFSLSRSRRKQQEKRGKFPAKLSAMKVEE
ncbi:hypothetical protein L6452_37891 [Arctium lappa]|uniref:Uncharacterized protein n=1 Tax=Arctium lappa TaxID=4217 RepID=A0ACB8Y4X9_ARCLA|nr:hypothetical protein L6452_37891 [Arctium lappa]